MNKITTAIIPAAGLGSRMFPYTKHINKLMLPILNKPVIHYLVDELYKSGITKIIISGRNLGLIEEYFKYDQKLITHTKSFGHKGTLQSLKDINKEVKIIYLDQKEPKGWMYEIYHAKELLTRKPFAVAFSDTLTYAKEPVTKQLIKKHLETNLNILSNGRYIFTNDIITILEKQKFSLGDDAISVNQVLSKLISKGNLLYLPLEEKFLDVGTPINYLKTMTFFGINSDLTKKEYINYLKELSKTTNYR